MTFDEYWQQNWTPTSMPGVFDVAMREIAEKAWNAGVESCTDNLESQRVENSEIADVKPYDDFEGRWPGDGSGMDDFADFNAREADDYIGE